MFTRGLVICLALAVASVAQAGAVLTLERTGTGDIPVGSSETINLYLTQSGAGLNPMLVRMIQLDMSASDPELSFAAPGTSGTIVEMWDYNTATGCPGTCGIAHLIDVDFTDGIASSAYGDASHLNPDATLQMNLADDAQVKIGEIVVTCEFDGDQTMDALNAADTDLDAGAKVMFGFGVNIDGTAITIWDAYGGDVTGGSLILPCRGVAAPDFVSAMPACDESLWRSLNNFMEITFDGPLGSIPAVGEVKIRELLADGAYGADLSDQFTFSEPASGVLRIDENGDVLELEHRKWYSVMNDGWTGGGAFEMNYQVAVGDANNDSRVLAIDVSVINTGIPCFNCPDDRRDINGDNRVLAIDVSVTNTSIPSFGVSKPSGHACNP